MMIFYKVDWTTAKHMSFHNVTPDAKPSIVRGKDFQAGRNQCHFYVYAYKTGTLKIWFSFKIAMIFRESYFPETSTCFGDVRKVPYKNDHFLETEFTSAGLGRLVLLPYDVCVWGGSPWKLYV
jgi:hypothetical protein